MSASYCDMLKLDLSSYVLLTDAELVKADYVFKVFSALHYGMANKKASFLMYSPCEVNSSIGSSEQQCIIHSLEWHNRSYFEMRQNRYFHSVWT